MSCATSARPVSRSPHTTLSTPGGRNSAAISAISSVVTGVVSDGLSTTVLPAAIAGRQLPDRHHHRVVPRRHLGAHADRLAPDHTTCGRPCTRPRPCPRACAPRRRRSGSGRPWADLLGHGQRDRLAGVPALGGDELVGPRLDRVGDPQQRQAALGRRGVAPGLEAPSAARASRRRRPPLRTPARSRIPRRCSGRPRRSSGPPRRRRTRHSTNSAAARWRGCTVASRSPPGQCLATALRDTRQPARSDTRRQVREQADPLIYEASQRIQLTSSA